jgi:hypothetical protein
LPRGRLEANRSPCFRLQLAPQRCHFALDRAQTQLDALLGGKLLAHNIGVAGMAAKTLRQPILEPGRRTPSAATAIGQPTTLRDIMPNRHVAAAQLFRDPLDAPPQPLQAQHRRDLVRRLHHLPPRQIPPRKRLHRFFHPTLLVSEGLQFPLSPGVQFYLSPDNNR